MVEKAKEQLSEVIFWNGKFDQSQLVRINDAVSRGFIPTIHWFEIPDENKPTHHRHFVLLVKSV